MWIVCHRSKGAYGVDYFIMKMSVDVFLFLRHFFSLTLCTGIVQIQVDNASRHWIEKERLAFWFV